MAHKWADWRHNTAVEGGGVHNASERGTKPEKAHKWANWLHNPYCLHKWANWLYNPCRQSCLLQGKITHVDYCFSFRLYGEKKVAPFYRKGKKNHDSTPQKKLHPLVV